MLVVRRSPAPSSADTRPSRRRGGPRSRSPDATSAALRPAGARGEVGPRPAGAQGALRAGPARRDDAAGARVRAPRRSAWCWTSGALRAADDARSPVLTGRPRGGEGCRRSSRRAVREFAARGPLDAGAGSGSGAPCSTCWQPGSSGRALVEMERGLGAEAGSCDPERPGPHGPGGRDCRPRPTSAYIVRSSASSSWTRAHRGVRAAPVRPHRRAPPGVTRRGP